MVHWSAQEHRLLLTIHHIIGDEWSMELLQREVSQLYEVFAHGRPSPLPAVPIQYADFACWERAWVRGDGLQRQLAYWRGGRSGAAPVAARPSPAPLAARWRCPARPRRCSRAAPFGGRLTSVG